MKIYLVCLVMGLSALFVDAHAAARDRSSHKDRKHHNEKHVKPSNTTTATEAIVVPDDGRPAIINLVKGSVRFVDGNGNGTLDPNEKGKIVFKVKNDGTGMAIGCKTRTKLDADAKDVKVEDVVLPMIPAGGVCEVEIPLTAGPDTQAKSFEVVYAVDETRGFGIEEQYIVVTTTAIPSPSLSLSNIEVSTSNGRSIQRKEPFVLSFNVSNTGAQEAKDAVVHITLPAGAALMEGEFHTKLGTLKPNMCVVLSYKVVMNVNYDGGDIPVKVNVTESSGRYGLSTTVNAKATTSAVSTRPTRNDSRVIPRR
ncbi:MAG: phage terminase large subunit family protein [Muribaculaceae bacterium]|nr:phage terminase large subunit family protein [Muribaculaceae bacterium]